MSLNHALAAPRSLASLPAFNNLIGAPLTEDDQCCLLFPQKILLSALKVCREKIVSVHCEKISFTYEYNGENNAEVFRISPRTSAVV